jgi:hypothetical protein
VSYELGDYYHASRPWYTVRALRSADAKKGEAAVFGWLHNGDWTWSRARSNAEMSAIPASRLTIGGLAEGRYKVVWWDTNTGKTTDGETTAASGGKVTVRVAELTTDAAFQLVRQ